MMARLFKYLLLLLFVAACSQAPSPSLPPGISIVKGIDPAGLQFPVWSPDGKTIAASYVIAGSPDFTGGPKPRSDVVLVDTRTWKLSILSRAGHGNLVADAWAPDSRSFVMFWSDGPAGNGNYLFELNNPNPTYFSEAEVLSPDLQKLATFRSPYIRITDLHGKTLRDFKVPINGDWSIYRWSLDMKRLALTIRESEGQRFENIYLLEMDSGNFVQFTNESSFFKQSPAISPNGQLLAYIMTRFGVTKIEQALVISRLDRSCQWTVPVDLIGYYAWSPDSQGMFMIGVNGVYVANLNILFGDNFAYRKDCQ